MKIFVFPVLFCALILPLSAQVPDGWAGYITYAPRPVAASTPLAKADLNWLAETAELVGKDGFSFLNRRDADHWVALTNQGSSWVLQIHDETALYNFRATVNPKTGAMAVQKGVDWVGTSRQDDVNRAAKMASGYLKSLRTGKLVFTGPASTASKPALTLLDKAEQDRPGAKDKHSAAPVEAVTDHSAHAMPPTPAHGETPSQGEGTTAGAGGAPLWQKLVDGNLRFVSGKVTHPNQSMARIDETSKGQHPFAIVVSCSDSRVPPEVLFDQGIGDLFVVRTAGEVVTEVELGSIEYAVEHLGAPYLVVLGHKKCGAVDATLKGGDLPPNIEAIAAQIRPAVEAAKFFKGDRLDNAIRENAKGVLAKIKGSTIVAEAIHEGKLNLKAAYYDIETGKVAALP